MNGNINKKIIRMYNFYFGFCLLFAGLIIGLTLGLAIGGYIITHPFSITVALILMIGFVVGVFWDWKIILDKI